MYFFGKVTSFLAFDFAGATTVHIAIKYATFTSAVVLSEQAVDTKMEFNLFAIFHLATKHIKAKELN